MLDLIAEHGADVVAGIVALMSLLKVIVRLTPTAKDDKVFGRLDDLLEALIPNYTKQGKDKKGE
tara:strand:- start:795 stop:986 length:192 start_codon:yes stop_codon:yes gene_type:complete